LFYVRRVISPTPPPRYTFAVSVIAFTTRASDFNATSGESSNCAPTMAPSTAMANARASAFAVLYDAGSSVLMIAAMSSL
jgi:hypothetical protein